MYSEYFKDSKIKIGEARSIRIANLSTIFPNIVPLRPHVKFWPAKVPLTPFKAPYIKLPALKEGEVQPNFLLYKPELLSPVRNQGDCGSCWAFALCDMLTDRLVISTGGLFSENCSVQHLLSCFEPNGCDGGSPEEGAMWMSTGKLISTEKSQPYSQMSGGSVSTKCSDKYKQFKVGVKPEEVYSIVEFIEEDNYDLKILENNVLNMKLELYEGGPFYCAMAVYDDLFTYTGLEPYKPNPNANLIGGHAIEIIGYCEKGVDKRKGYEDGYWFCRNSWGKDWPLQTTTSGFFTVVMGKNYCGIESRCGFAEPILYGKIKGKPKSLQELRYDNIHDYYE
jgi:hypothetical protein